MATFGYTTIGGSNQLISASWQEAITGSIFTMPENGTADSITVSLKVITPCSRRTKCAIYKHSDLSLVGSTEEITISLTATQQFFTFNFITKPNLVSGEVYILEVWSEYLAGNASTYIAYHAGSASQGHLNPSYNYNSFPNPQSSPTHYDYEHSIYCTYTPGGPTYVNISDTGSGSDVVSLQANVPLSDVGLGTESLSLQAQIPVSDSGLGTDTVLGVNQALVSESGAGSDAMSIQAQVPLAESCAGADTLGVQAQISVGDAGSGAETFAIQAQIPIQDAAVGSDAAVIQGQIPVAETGAGNDAIAVEVRVPVNETGSGSEVINAEARIPIFDSGLGSDGLSLQAQVPITENGQGIDGVSVTGGGAITVSDIGESLDSLFVQAQVAIIDSCQGLEGLSISCLLSILDQCTGNDIIIISIAGLARPLIFLVLKDFALPITPAGKMMMIIGDEAVPMNKSDPKKKIFLISRDLAIELA